VHKTFCTYTIEIKKTVSIKIMSSLLHYYAVFPSKFVDSYKDGISLFHRCEKYVAVGDQWSTEGKVSTSAISLYIFTIYKFLLLALFLFFRYILYCKYLPKVKICT
jgi:hypothetical protein